MKNCKIKINKLCVSSNFRKTTNVIDRLIGLMFKPSLQYDGLLIDKCNSIHTFFMLFPIDVYFLDSNNKVIKVIQNMSPWRLSWIYWRAKIVLEIPSKHNIYKINLGDLVEVENV